MAKSVSTAKAAASTSIPSKHPGTKATEIPFTQFTKRRFDEKLKRLFLCLNTMFNIVLVEPEIPPNTGNVGRLCLAVDAHLHLVKPLGFDIDDRTLRRAGLDYWDQVKVSIWDSLDALFASQPVSARNFFLTTKCERPYYHEKFRVFDW